MSNESFPVNISPQDLWTFSVNFYQLDNNKALLLGLQDSAAMNVNLVIFVFYLLGKNVQVNAGEIDTFATEIKELDSLTSRFREKRRQQKPDADSFRQCKEQQQYTKMLEQELNYEKQQQVLLISVYHKLVEGRAQTHLRHVKSSSNHNCSDLPISKAISALVRHFELEQTEHTNALRELSQSFAKLSNGNSCAR